MTQTFIPTDDDITSPPLFERQAYDNAEKAVERLIEIYDAQTAYLRSQFDRFIGGKTLATRVHAYYPFIRLKTESFANIDSRLSFGHVASPGLYETTITRPRLFASYLIEQITALLDNHHVPVFIGLSNTPIPIHFAYLEGMQPEEQFSSSLTHPLRNIFDVPDLSTIDDHIANGTYETPIGKALPLSLFPAARIDYSLQRLSHYTATKPEHFQNFVLFTNYQFYIDEFAHHAQQSMQDNNCTYECFIEPGNFITHHQRHGGGTSGEPAQRLPQMPAYHLVGKNHSGITLVNIGVGPSNAKTITDHIAVLRPHVWLMLGHCAGLRNTQKLGDYVLAHGYVRADHVLDADLPLSVPIPPLAEVQVAMEQAVSQLTGKSGYDLKSVMRTGTVASVDDRNWELRDQREPVRQLSQSRAIAIDMESATIAANGFRFRVPYGVLLCVSDRPLHGELKLPGMADAFYRQQVKQHLNIGLRALEKLRAMPLERLHSRKLRSFNETAFQ